MAHVRFAPAFRILGPHELTRVGNRTIIVTRRLGVMVELLAKLCGWIWIAANIAIVGLAGMALFSDWSWWNVFFALVIAGVSKWLAEIL